MFTILFGLITGVITYIQQLSISMKLTYLIGLQIGLSALIFMFISLIVLILCLFSIIYCSLFFIKLIKSLYKIL